MSRIDDDTLVNLERQYASGLTSSELIDVCASHGIHLSEANLRKFVQPGLVPSNVCRRSVCRRSVRVGRKGKHKGSLGLYPAQGRELVTQLSSIESRLTPSRSVVESLSPFVRASAS